MTASQPDGVLAVHSIQHWKKRKRTGEITVQFIAEDSTKTPKGERKREREKKKSSVFLCGLLSPGAIPKK